MLKILEPLLMLLIKCASQTLVGIARCTTVSRKFLEGNSGYKCLKSNTVTTACVDVLKKGKRLYGNASFDQNRNENGRP